MKLASRLALLTPYLTGQFSARAKELQDESRLVANFTLGDPDSDCPALVKQEFRADPLKPGWNRYQPPLGIKELRDAIAVRYERTYEVKFDSGTQVVVMPGAKPALYSLFGVMVEPGDYLLAPNPGYPIYGDAAIMFGASVKLYRVGPGVDHWQSINSALREVPAGHHVVFALNFPNNPTTAMVDLEFYRRMVDLAENRGDGIITDMAYAALGFDGRPVSSIFQVDGAKKVAVEVGTFSKEYSMQGLRAAWVVGNSEIMGGLAELVKHTSYGMPRPVQKAALVALKNCGSDAKETCKLYRHRATFLTEQLGKVGWDIAMPNGTMFVWAPLPKGHTNAMQFAIDLLESEGVAVTPGTGFGSNGEGYVRFALVEKDPDVVRAAKAIGCFLGKG